MHEASICALLHCVMFAVASAFNQLEPQYIVPEPVDDGCCNDDFSDTAKFTHDAVIRNDLDRRRRRPLAVPQWPNEASRRVKRNLPTESGRFQLNTKDLGALLFLEVSQTPSWSRRCSVRGQRLRMKDPARNGHDRKHEVKQQALKWNVRQGHPWNGDRYHEPLSKQYSLQAANVDCDVFSSSVWPNPLRHAPKMMRHAAFIKGDGEGFLQSALLMSGGGQSDLLDFWNATNNGNRSRLATGDHSPVRLDSTLPHAETASEPPFNLEMQNAGGFPSAARLSPVEGALPRRQQRTLNFQHRNNPLLRRGTPSSPHQRPLSPTLPDSNKRSSPSKKSFRYKRTHLSTIDEGFPVTKFPRPRPTPDYQRYQLDKLRQFSRDYRSNWDRYLERKTRLKDAFPPNEPPENTGTPVNKGTQIEKKTTASKDASAGGKGITTNTKTTSNGKVVGEGSGQSLGPPSPPRPSSPGSPQEYSRHRRQARRPYQRGMNCLVEGFRCVQLRKGEKQQQQQQQQQPKRTKDFRLRRNASKRAGQGTLSLLHNLH